MHNCTLHNSHRSPTVIKPRRVILLQTSLKASRTSPTSFLFRSLIFLFFFGTDVAAARKRETKVKLHLGEKKKYIYMLIVPQ